MSPADFLAVVRASGCEVPPAPDAVVDSTGVGTGVSAYDFASHHIAGVRYLNPRMYDAPSAGWSVRRPDGTWPPGTSTLRRSA